MSKQNCDKENGIIIIVACGVIDFLFKLSRLKPDILTIKSIECNLKLREKLLNLHSAMLFE